MNGITILTEMYYGQFTPPLVKRTIRHRITDQATPRNHRSPNPSQQNEWANKMYDYIKAHPGTCCNDVAKVFKKDKAYMYRIRAILLDQGRIDQVKGQRKAMALYIKE